MFGWKSKHHITRMMEEYLLKADEAMELFEQAMNETLMNGLSSTFDEFSEKLSRAESSCDEIRRRVEEVMYEKALIPESREDILNLLEKLDKIPNRAQHVVRMVQDLRIHFPGACMDPIRKLFHLTGETVDTLLKAVRSAFTQTEDVRGLVNEVDSQESATDQLERDLIRSIFRDGSIPSDQRVILREIVTRMSAIADAAENAADWLTIIVVKRLV